MPKEHPGLGNPNPGCVRSHGADGVAALLVSYASDMPMRPRRAGLVAALLVSYASDMPMRPRRAGLVAALLVSYASDMTIVGS